LRTAEAVLEMRSYCSLGQIELGGREEDSVEEAAADGRLAGVVDGAARPCAGCVDPDAWDAAMF
jgi:hypothetical protein